VIEAPALGNANAGGGLDHADKVADAQERRGDGEHTERCGGLLTGKRGEKEENLFARDHFGVTRGGMAWAVRSALRSFAHIGLGLAVRAVASDAHLGEDFFAAGGLLILRVLTIQQDRTCQKHDEDWRPYERNLAGSDICESPQFVQRVAAAEGEPAAHAGVVRNFQPAPEAIVNIFRAHKGARPEGMTAVPHRAKFEHPRMASVATDAAVADEG